MMTQARLADIGLRLSVTPRATDVSDRISALILALPYFDSDRTAIERRAQLKEWQFVISMTIAWGQDIGADEHAEWLAKIA